MDDCERLRRWIEAGEIVAPDPKVPNTVDLARALAQIGGVEDFTGDPGAARIAERLGHPDHLVFVLVDGLGLDWVLARPADSFLRAHVAMELRAVFPSTTAAALVSLATGLWPGRHAVPCWWTWLPEIGRVARIIPFEDRETKQGLDAWGMTPEAAYPVPPLGPRMRRVCRALVPERTVAGPFTRYLHSGMQVSGYERFEQAVDRAIVHVRDARTPTLTILYFPGFDHAAHECGPDAPAAQAQLEMADREIARLAGALERRACIAVSADHGQIRVEDGQKILIGAGDPILAHCVVPPFGEPRVPFFRVHRAAEFARAFRDRFGGTHTLVAIEEAAAQGLFGPDGLDDRTRRRLGDFVAIPHGREVLCLASEEEAHLRGYHGGLLSEEMRIPLIVSR
jgi:hypothetical protein